MHLNKKMIQIPWGHSLSHCSCIIKYNLKTIFYIFGGKFRLLTAVKAYTAGNPLLFLSFVWQKKKVLQEAALSLLRSDNTVFDKALVLCQMHNFKEGVLYLYEKGKL